MYNIGAAGGLQLTLTALGLSAALILVVVAIFYIGLAFASYADGRKQGGYPIFAKLRRKRNLLNSAYDHGFAHSREKIAKGGYIK